MKTDKIRKFFETTEIRKMEAVAWMMHLDNNMVYPEDWDGAPLHILVTFQSTGATRSVSSTFTALQDFILLADRKVFVDYSYFPTVRDINVLDRNEIPLWFGNVSHRSAEDYDIVFASSSTLLEFQNIIASILRQKWPVYHNDRIDVDGIPLIMMGGIPVSDQDPLGGGNGGVPDLCYVGYAEGRLTEIVKFLIETKVKFGNLTDSKVKKYLIENMVKKYDNLYYPAGYDVIYKEDKCNIKEIKLLKPWVPEKVAFHTEHSMDEFPAFERKMFPPDNRNADSADILISHGCSGGGQCYFCREGYACGGWRERSFDKVVESFDNSKFWAAPNTMGFYSFNLNYYSRFLDLVYESAKRFSQLSLINMRTDVVSETPEYFLAAKEVGMRRISIPIEGFGERQRNIVLNKSLSFEQIKKAFITCFKLNLIEIKIGMILTGYETKEDLIEGVREFEELARIRDEMNASTNLRSNVTALCHFPHTALGYVKRLTALGNMKNLKLLKPLIRALKGRVRFKFSSKQYDTVVQQLVLDLGRITTPIWVDMAVNGNLYYTSPNQKFLDELVARMNKEGIDWKASFEAKPRDHIFPSHMMGQGPKTEKYQDLLYKNVLKKNIPPCTKTIIDRGKKVICYDCGYCTTQEMKDSIISRKIWNKNSVKDIQRAVFENKPLASYRIAFEVDDSKEFIGKETYSFVISSKILQSSKEVFDAYHSSKHVSVNVFLRGELWDYFKGRFYYDMWLKNTVEVDWLKIIEDANSKLHYARILSVVPSEFRTRPDMTHVCISEGVLNGFSLEQMKQFIRNYDGDFKEAVSFRRSDYDFTLQPMKLNRDDFPSIYLKNHVDGVKFVLIHKMWINPHLFICHLVKRSYRNIIQLCSVKILGYFGSEVGLCKTTNCPNSTRVSELTKKISPLCVNCLAKTLLNK